MWKPNAPRVPKIKTLKLLMQAQTFPGDADKRCYLLVSSSPEPSSCNIRTSHAACIPFHLFLPKMEIRGDKGGGGGLAGGVDLFKRHYRHVGNSQAGKYYKDTSAIACLLLNDLQQY